MAGECDLLGQRVAIEIASDIGYMCTMKKTAKTSTGVRSKSSASKPLSYRGVKLLAPAVPPKTPLRELRKAVDAALAKHSHAFAKGK